MSKTAYQFDHAGFYTGTTEADESPLEPGVHHLPARCTYVAPPAATATQWPRWNGAAWKLVNRPKAANDNDPVVKLREFLAANPDVAAVLEKGSV